MFAGRPKHLTCAAREYRVFAVSVSFTEFAAPFGTPLLFNHFALAFYVHL
jgi:hypothetical protein